jgi:hypothetical protein
MPKASWTPQEKQGEHKNGINHLDAKEKKQQKPP